MKTFKHLLRGSLMILPFILLNFSLQATTTTWLGANGDWHNPANWDTGVVPTLDDEVIIPSGRAKIFSGGVGGANFITVQSGARMYVYNGGQLEVGGITNEFGIENLGRIYIYGDLEVHKILSTTGSISGIYTNNYFYISSTGIVDIYDIEGYGITNESAGYFYNRGSLTIESVDKSNIYNLDRFRNNGTIELQANTTYPNNGFLNFDDFRNYSNGELIINGGGAAGLANNLFTAITRNYGTITAESSSQIGTNNNGTFINYAGSLLLARYNGTTGFYNASTGVTTNYGSIQGNYNSLNGHINLGEVYNHEHMIYLGNPTGARLFSGSLSENSGGFTTGNNSINGVFLDGDFENTIDGFFGCGDKLTVGTYGVFNNNGMMDSEYSSGTHNIYAGGSIVNHGAIEDLLGSFPTSLDNQQVIFETLSGTMQVGVPFPNALDQVDLSNVIIGDWKTSISGAVAGTYDPVTNEFTPNAAAVGITRFYISVQINGGGLIRNFNLDITGGVTPFKDNSPSTVFYNNENTGSELIVEKMNVYPNPSEGNLSLSSKLFEKEETEIQIFNTIGQMVWKRKIPIDAIRYNINFPASLNNGTYFIHAIQNGKSVAVENIQLQR